MSVSRVTEKPKIVAYKNKETQLILTIDILVSITNKKKARLD